MLRAVGNIFSFTHTIQLHQAASPRRRTPPRKKAKRITRNGVVAFTGIGNLLGGRPRSVRRSGRVTRPTVRAAEAAAARDARVAGLAIMRNARTERNIRVDAKKAAKPMKLTPKDRQPSGGGGGSAQEVEPGDPIEVQVGGMVIGGGTTAYIMHDLGNTPLHGGMPRTLDQIRFIPNYREAVQVYNAFYKIKFTAEVYQAHPWLRNV